MRRTVYEPEHQQFREVVREFLAREVAPHAQAWETAWIVDREVYRAVGKHGIIGFNVPEEFGGGGVADFRFNAVVSEELAMLEYPVARAYLDARVQTSYGGRPRS